MSKSRKGNPNNTERQVLRNWLTAHGMNAGDAAQLTAPGRNREQQALVIIAHLRNGKKAKK